MVTTDRLIPVEAFGSDPPELVRGVGLKTGVRYETRGTYYFTPHTPELRAPFHLVSAFELLRHGGGDPPPSPLLLVVPFRVTVRTDGRVIARMEAPMLLSCPGDQAGVRNELAETLNGKAV
jgi:hypothetical protein